METSETSLTTFGISQHGGTLFTLPREVRDEIYRLVVKDLYFIYACEGKTHMAGIRTEESDFSILETSKATSREVLEIYYQESVFSFTTRFGPSGIICLPKKLTDRMKNVRLVVLNINILYLRQDELEMDNVNSLCKAVITPFAGTHIARKNLHVEVFCDGPGMIGMLPIPVFEILKALTGFRTLVIEVSPNFLLRKKMENEMATEKEVSDSIYQTLTGALRVIRNTLEPSLGSATENFVGRVGRLTFHPREHTVNSTR